MNQTIIKVIDFLCIKHLKKSLSVSAYAENIVDLKKYIQRLVFPKWIRYEIPIEEFVDIYWRKYLTVEQRNKIKDILWIIVYKKYDINGKKYEVATTLSTYELEALFLDVVKSSIGEKNFVEILERIDEENTVLNTKGLQIFQKYSTNIHTSWKQRIKYCIFSEVLCDESFQEGEFIHYKLEIDDTKELCNQLEAFDYSKLFFLMSYNGSVVFEMNIFGSSLVKNWLCYNIKEMSHTNWENIEEVKQKLTKIKLDKKLKITFALKTERFYPQEVIEKDIKRLFSLPDFALLHLFFQQGLIEIITTETNTKGVNLKHISKSCINSIQDAQLIILKGGNNTIGAWGIQKAHFILGMALEQGIKRYTGLNTFRDAGELPLGYCAYIPENTSVVENVSFQVHPKQNVKQFVQARQNRKNAYEHKNNCFIENAYPSVLGESERAKKAFSEIQSLALQKNMSFQEALKFYSNQKKEIASFILDYSVLELNFYFHFDMMKQSFLKGDDIKVIRSSYTLKVNGWKGLFGKKPGEHIGEKIESRQQYMQCAKEGKVIISTVIFSQKALQEDYILSGIQASEENLKLITFHKISHDRFQKKNGIILNFLYFFTERLRKLFNDRTKQVELEELPHISNSYIGLQKDRISGEIFAPLYNKGAIAIFPDGKVAFRRIQMGSGVFSLGDIQFRWIPFTASETEKKNAAAIAYTPMFDGNKKENGSTHFGAHFTTKESAITGKRNRRILTPDQNRIQIVIFRNKILQIRKTPAEIPPCGWVLSIKMEIFERIKQQFSLRENKDKSGEVYFLPENASPSFAYHLPSNWNNACWIMGGGLLLYSHQDGDIPISEILKKEGWHLNISRQTQESDISDQSIRGPLQIIGQTKQKDFFICTFSGRSIQSIGVTHDEALDIIKRELKAQKKKLAFAFNLDGGSSVNIGFATKGKYYPLNIPAKGDMGTCDIRPVNGVAFIQER